MRTPLWFRILPAIALLVFNISSSRAQITVSSDKSAAMLAAELVGGGVTILGSTLTCHGASNGIYTTGAIDPLGGIPAGIVLTSGSVVDTLTNQGISNPASDFETSSYSGPGDADLATLAGTTLSNTHDACVLELDFKAAGDNVKFKYVFGSEEYPEFACSGFNDVFGFLISGPGFATPTNIALIPGTSIPVCINSVNSAPTGTSYPLSTCASMGTGSPYNIYYVNNSTSTLLIYDGLTTVFTAEADVTPCETYHLKLGIADVGDFAYNSGVFIQKGSLTSSVPSAVESSGTSGLPYCIRGCGPGKFTFTIPTPQDTPVVITYSISGTAVNGFDYATIGTTAVIPPASTSTVVNINTLLVPPTGPKVVTLTVMVPDPCNPDSFTAGAAANLTILDSFSFKILTPDTSICRGESLTLRAQGDPIFDGILDYTWSPGSSLATTSVLTPVLATPTVTTTYTLTGTTDPLLGCPIKTVNVTVTVYPPPSITMDSPYVRTCVGVPVVLHATIPGYTVPLTYSWSPATDLSSSTVWNPTVTPSMAGDITYTLSAHPTANASCVSRDTVRVHTIAPYVLHNVDTAICIGKSVQTRITGSNEFLWLWTPPTGVSNVYLKTPVITPTVSGTYSVTGSYAHCPDQVRSFYIEVDTPAIAVNIIDTICLGMIYNVDLTVPGSTGTGSGYYHYQWTPPTYLSNDTMPNPVITPTVSTSLEYNVVTRPHAEECAVTSNIKLEVLPKQISVFPPDTAICMGEHIQVIATGGHPAFSYQWLPTAGIAVSNILAPVITPDTSATYVVTARFHTCPDMTDTMIVDVQPNPTVFVGGNKFVCEFDSLHIHAATAPSWYTNYSYSWTPATSLDATTGSDVVFNGRDTATVIVTVSTANGRCTAIDSARITVYPGNFASLTPASQDFCPDDSAILAPEGGVAYVWSPALYLNDPTALNPVIKPITDMSYSVVATSIWGCKDTLTYYANVHPAGVIYMPDSVTIYPGETYQISPESNCSSFMWFPPAGLSNPYIINPVASPEVSTKYIVTGFTEHNCPVMDSINVYVDPESLLAVPNAFTPGSGGNSEFKIIRRGIATLNYFRIFNRWGNLIFESRNIETGWNGEYKGVPQPFGVYVYQIEAVTNTGKVFQKQGNVTLIR